MLTRNLVVQEDETIVGKAEYRNPNFGKPQNILEELETLKASNLVSEGEQKNLYAGWKMNLFSRFPGGHVVPEYEILLTKGIGQYYKELSEIKELQKDDEKIRYFSIELLLLDCMKTYIDNYQKAIRKVNKDNSKENLNWVDSVCEKIKNDKPQTFIEALQLLWISNEIMILEGDIRGISMGRMDQYLYPYYINDKTIDNGEKYKLLLSLWSKFEIEKNNLAFQNVTIGGLLRNQKDGCNELTIEMIRAQKEVHASEPMLSLRINEYTPKEVWDEAFELLKTGVGLPALFNDNTVIKSKVYAGVEMKDAYNYSIVGCVEPTVGGKEYSHTEGMRINLSKILELIINKGKCVVTQEEWKLKNVKEISEIKSYEQFYLYYLDELENVLFKMCNFIKKADSIYKDNWPAPYLTLFMEDCSVNGWDVTEGKTKYHNLSVNFAGMANIANSLYVIKKYVYDEKKLNISEIRQVMNNNFESAEQLIADLEGLKFYGNDNDEVDFILKGIIDFIIDFLERQSTLTMHFQAGFYTVHLHSAMGKTMLATPDGRKKGIALANSLSPRQGTDVSGPLAVFNSINKLPIDKMSNGMVLDMKFAENHFDREQRDKLKSVIEVYFEKGGMEIQINCVNKQMLIDAQNNPEEYKNLIVRVSGFSMYFVLLDKSLQDEIIMRCEHTV